MEPRTGLELIATQQGVLAGTLNGKQLCSRHRPLDEAATQANAIDLVEHAAVVVLGFGLGYHVKQLAERSRKATLIIVFEPDIALLRAVFERIDHSTWMKDALILFITDADDRGVLARKLDGAESILAQGVHFMEHAPSRARLADHASRFTSLFTSFIGAAKTTLMTTLMRSVDTTRNLMLNIDHYALGSGISELHYIAQGCPAVVVSAGPSLHRNMHVLKQPGVRDKCVIIAVQTTLKPLLAAGIVPHFVTALDYHEISKRFYEGLTAEQVKEITLVVDPKAHPVILDSFPGPVRCCANGFLDGVLGALKQEMGELPAGATVAHLAVYLAKYLGCNPIALVGQDLGFTDGLYYAPHAAIHDIWASELNPFNTIEMMEWQRIVRHRLHLKKVRDVAGKSLYTDAQMDTYLQQFERDFAEYVRAGLMIVDASEGGVAKRHTITKPLAMFLNDHVSPREKLPSLPKPAGDRSATQTSLVRKRVADVRADAVRIRELSRNTASLLQRMIADQHDLPAMARHFEKIERNRKEVQTRFETFQLLNALNQLGAFNRMKADRRLHMQQGLSPIAMQRAQLERDLTNVQWIADAAEELLDQLESSQQLLVDAPSADGRPSHAPKNGSSPSIVASPGTNRATSHIAALIPIDPDRNGIGIPRSLNHLFRGQTVLQVTLESLGRSRHLESIILITSRGFDVEPLIDRNRISLPIEIEQVDGSPFGREHAAIAAARLWADTCWRGGIAGMSVYDEVLCPQVMWPIMERRGLTAALIAGPDWPLIRVTETGGCDDVMVRHLEHPTQHNLVFTQSPPGLCGCVISATLMQELSQRNRLSTVGGLLVYQPHAPQGDPIARDVNVQIDHDIRQSLGRFTCDSPRQHELLDSFAGGTGEIKPIVQAWQESITTPQHITLEICTDRTSYGRFKQHPHGAIARPMLSLEVARRMFEQLAAFNMPDLVLTLDGVGDPLLHPQFDSIIQLARVSGFRGIQVCTELLSDRSVLDRLLACNVDVISVDLNADRAATYQRMMGIDRFKDVLLNIEYLSEHRTKLTDHAGTSSFALPWIVPHLQRCTDTYEDVDSFFDRWQHTLGCAVIVGVPPFAHDDLAPAITPRRVRDRQLRRSMTILCDGKVVPDQWDWLGKRDVGNIREISLAELWRRLRHPHSAAS